MPRSNTLPTNNPPNSSNKKIQRSATTHELPHSQTRQHSLHLPAVLHPHSRSSYDHDSPPPSPPQRTLTRQSTGHTRYVSMLLAVDEIPRIHNIVGSFFTWILLAGFIIFPGTFTTIQQLDANSGIQSNQAANEILNSVKNAPLLVVAGVCCGIGAAGMLWLWWRWNENYVWLLNKIFLPGCLNSLAGIISTVINVYGQQGGVWSVSAKVTAIVTGSCMVVTAVLFLVYNQWVLQKVKRSHGRDMEQARNTEGESETLAEKVERKVHQPALEPGSVV